MVLSTKSGGLDRFTRKVHINTGGSTLKSTDTIRKELMSNLPEKDGK